MARPLSRAVESTRSLVGWLLGLPRRLVGVLVSTWNALPRFVRSLTVSLAIAIGIEGLIHHYAHTPLLEAFQDKAVDWTVALYRNAPPKRPNPIPFTVLDIDTETYQRWDEPLFTPRDQLSQLMAVVLNAGPTALIVDVELSARSWTYGDEVLWDLVNRHSQGSPDSERDVAPLILPRGLRTHAAGPESEDVQIAIEKESFLDSASHESSQVFWASPLFQKGRDGSVRRWRLWEAAQISLGESMVASHVVPSVQLLTAALVNRPEGFTSKQAMDSLQCMLLPLATQHTEPDRHSPSSSKEKQSTQIQLGSVSVSAFPSRLNQRIVYRYPAPSELREGETYPSDPSSGRSMLTVVPAYPISEGTSVSHEPFRDRIVVIGGSYPESRDIHPTPLGPMPGAFILVNAIDSLLEYGEIRGLSGIARYAIVVTLVVTFAVLFSVFGSGVASYLASALILIALLPLSVLYFKEGYWIDFALPLIGVLVHRRVSEAEEAFHRLKGRSSRTKRSKSDV